MPQPSVCRQGIGICREESAFGGPVRASEDKNPREELRKRRVIEMTSVDVIDLYTSLENLGVEIWIDGGWGVDALLGEQTRAHKDLDITIQQNNIPMIREFIQALGFRDLNRDDTTSWNFVLGDENGREVDVHVIVFDERGNGMYGPPEKGEMYPAASLTGTGNIQGQRVRCISPEWMVKFHSGYQLKEKDFRDVSALCRKFDIALPLAYQHLKERLEPS